MGGFQIWMYVVVVVVDGFTNNNLLKTFVKWEYVIWLNQLDSTGSSIKSGLIV